MTIDYKNTPRSLRTREAIADRVAKINEPHVMELTNYVTQLRGRFPPKWEFPDFDPYDGGQNAELLFLMEKPGPMTSANGGVGSGFVSRNNDDPTAAAIFEFMVKAGIPREGMVLWNTVPGWNGSIAMDQEERREGRAEIPTLISLLPKLKGVVLVGPQAQQAEKQILELNLPVFLSSHPSPKIRSINRDLWDAIPLRWASAFDAIG